MSTQKAESEEAPLRVETDFAGRQILGGRENQEDAYGIVPPEEFGGGRILLAVVADGMGGHAAGEVASELSVQAFLDGFFQAEGSDDASRMWSGLETANRKIRDAVDERPSLEGMGTTLVSVLLREGSLRWISVGDSPLYLVREGELFALNELHVDALEFDAGEGLPPAPRSGALASAVVGERLRKVDDESPVDLEPGDRVLIATDGLDTLDAEDILEVFARLGEAAASELADSLIRKVEERAGPKQDNTTVVVICWN